MKKTSKAGWIYFLLSKREDGTKKIYTGQTERSVYERVGEHIQKKDKKSWAAKSTYNKLIGAIWSTNRFKAEKTIKKLSPKGKRFLAKKGANQYKKVR